MDLKNMAKDIKKGASKVAGSVTEAAKVSSKSVSRAANTASKAISSSAGDASKAIGDAATTAGGAIAKGASETSKAISVAIEEGKRKKYNPLFLERYNAADFDMPKLVVIADEDSRKGIEMCEGAIGWLNTKNVPEIVFLYEEFIPECGKRFYPRAICGASYYKHPFKDDLYLQVKDYLQICKTNQLTELKNIASCLGAVHCRVEVHETKTLRDKFSFKGDANISSPLKGKSASFKTNQSYSSEDNRNEKFSIAMSETFEQGTEPKRPELIWFADDFEIQSLIEKRCNPEMGGVLNSYSIDITASTSSTMSHDYAGKIDGSLKGAGIKAGANLSHILEEEDTKKFIYKIDF